MRLILPLLLSLCAATSHAADVPPDPLAVLLTKFSGSIDEKAAAAPGGPRESGERLARIQADLSLVAAGYEGLRAPVHAERSREAAVGLISPELRPFFKDRDSILDAAYRTLAVVDYTWALRFPEPPCVPAEKRRVLLLSHDGLFTNPSTGAPSPWLARLLGPASYGRSAESALDRASAETKLSPRDYERLRVRAQRLTEALSSDRAEGSARSQLYCKRAAVEGELARAHRFEKSPTLASRVTGEPRQVDSSVFILAVPAGKTYRALGAAFALDTPQGEKIITDASLVRGRENLVLFAQPGPGGALSGASRFIVERAASAAGPASGRMEGGIAVPALIVAASPAAPGDLTVAVGHINSAGPWTTTQGLVTAAGEGVFQTDALISAEMAGAPVLNEAGEVVGVATLQDGAPFVADSSALRRILSGGDAEMSADAALISARATGSGSILTAARAMDSYALKVPGGEAIESGLPANLGGVSWEGGGGVGGFRPTGYAGPPSGYSSYGGSGYDSGGWENQVGTSLGNAMGDVAIAGIGALFHGINKMFSGGGPSSSARVRRVQPQKPAPTPPPPPKEKLKAVGLVLSADKTSVATGDSVMLTATVSFIGEEGSKAGIPVNFAADGDRVAFADGKTSSTNGAGVASLTVQIIGDAASNAQDALDDLTREDSRRAGDDVADRPRAISNPKADANTKVKTAAKSEDDALDKEENSAHEGLPVSDEEGAISTSETPDSSSGLTESGSVIGVPAEAARVGAETLTLTSVVPVGGVVDHELGAKTQLAARIGQCPPGTVAANAYGQQLDAAPGQNAAPDSLKEMERYTRCDQQEAEAEMDCGEKDTTCRGDRLRALGYDFKYCPGRVYLPSSGSKSGQAAVPRGMRPFQYVKCVPKSSLPEYGKAYSDGGGNPDVSTRRDNAHASDGSDDSSATSSDAKALLEAEPIGSALKEDRFHRAAAFMRNRAARLGKFFKIVGGDGRSYTLTQISGDLDGEQGRYEYLVNSDGELTHQAFIRGGSINGKINVP